MFHVKHSAHPEQIDATTVKVRLQAVGVDASEHQCEQIARHSLMVLEANARMNLTRITAAEDVLALHIVDSVAFLAHCEPLTGWIVDIGSGAGYPGIPLSILGREICLCESIKKKAAFLQQCVDDLGLDATVAPVRAEELSLSAPRSASIVIARAVSALPSLVELSSPLLRDGGRLVALKGTPDASELAAAATAARMCGMTVLSRTEYALPTGEARTLFVFERRGTPRLSLPRRPGMAQRQPLGES